MTEHQATYMIDVLERILFILAKFERLIDFDAPEPIPLRQTEHKEPT